jgi:threonine dehydratase
VADDAGAVTLADVSAAAERIAPYVVRTPLERSAALSTASGADIWLKFECFQKTGSFKLRGALNALLLTDAPHVVTVSAGNHGLGIARAAQLLGRRATVVVPETASPAKVEGLKNSGAELLLLGTTYDDAELAGRRLAHERDLPFVSAYNDPAVIAGGGTIALEILHDLPETRAIVVPVGGGGLSSGIGVGAQGATVLGAQSSASPALHAALRAGALVTVDVQESLADGLSGNVEQGSITFDLVRQHVRDIVLVEESEIANAMRFLAQREHVLVEGSAAVGVAAVLGGRLRIDGPLAVVLTGRNVALAVLQQYVFA